MGKEKSNKSDSKKIEKTRKRRAAGPCAAAAGAAESNGGKTYSYEICAASKAAAKTSGYRRAKGEFKANLEQAARLTVDCDSHKCQGVGQKCAEKQPRFSGVGKVAGSENAQLAALQNCEVEGEKKYDYEVRLKGACIIKCECGAA